MFRKLLQPNLQAQDNLELFFVAAIVSLLTLRFALYLAGYPQVGGGSLHIAHMLYGGLLMLASIVLFTAFLGAQLQRIAALIGGIGFGIFIDEIGKFLTKDNNYFFRPAVGILYAIFMILYLIISALGRKQKLSSLGYQLNALRQLEEAVRHDLDVREKASIERLLKKADQKDEVTKALQVLLKQLNAIPTPPPNALSRIVRKIERGYARFWTRKSSSGVVSAIFVVIALAFLVVAIFTSFDNLDDLRELLGQHLTYGHQLVLGQLASSAASVVLVMVGAIQLPLSRLKAFEQFRRATLINLLLTEFFIFSRIQFHALPGFIVTLLVFIGLRLAIDEERRSTSQQFD